MDRVYLLIRELGNIYELTPTRPVQYYTVKLTGGFLLKVEGRFSVCDRIEIRGRTFPMELIKEASGTEATLMFQLNGVHTDFTGKFIFLRFQEDVITFYLKERKPYAG